MIDLAKQVVPAAVYGWKAHYLSRMHQWGLNVPAGLAMAVHEDAELIDAADLKSAVAVRSSGVSEDSDGQSLAGSFLTLLNVVGVSQVRDAIRSVRRSGSGITPMGVIVQQMVTPLIAGVAFSCEPVSLDEHRLAVSWTRGTGDALVSHGLSASDLLVDRDTGEVLVGDWPMSGSLLVELTDLVRLLTKSLGRPVDVEWCVEADSDRVTLLQVRPVVLPQPAAIELTDVEAFTHLPAQIGQHSKLVLRRQAASLGVPMSRARVVLANRLLGAPEVPALLLSRESSGRSVVLLHPQRVAGRVIREFARDCSTDVEFFVRGCQRYSIRQYPTEDDVNSAILNTLDIGLSDSPIACVVEQEVLHAYATGIVRATSEGYIVELALGHFVPKGYVETSTYVLDRAGGLIHKVENEQRKAYHFLNGHVIVEEPPYEQLEVTENDLRRIIADLQPMLQARPGAALEFGVLGATGNFRSYLIDVAESDQDAEELTSDAMARGVISAGVADGQVVDLREKQVLDDLNAHLYDAQSDGAHGQLEPTIYIARSTSIDLLPLARRAAAGSGFIFEQGSILAHLPVVLRELGLPAVLMERNEIYEALQSQEPTMHIDTSDYHISGP